MRKASWEKPHIHLNCRAFFVAANQQLDGAQQSVDLVFVVTLL